MTREQFNAWTRDYYARSDRQHEAAMARAARPEPKDE